jgi:TetR/AcrR family transcriptional repressor of uid operon
MARKRNESEFEYRRQMILRAAEALFVEQGFHQTGMAAICAAAGMSPGALYRYFPSKTDIIRAIVEEERRETARLFTALEKTVGVRSGLISTLGEIIVEVSSPSYAKLALEIAAEAARDPEIGSIIEAAEAETHQQLVALLEAAQYRGEIGRAVSPQASAAFIEMLLDGAMGNAGARIAALAPDARREALATLVEGLLGSAPRV